VGARSDDFHNPNIPNHGSDPADREIGAWKDHFQCWGFWSAEEIASETNNATVEIRISLVKTQATNPESAIDAGALVPKNVASLIRRKFSTAFLFLGVCGPRVP
jgi:hypothetical protein